MTSRSGPGLHGPSGPDGPDGPDDADFARAEAMLTRCRFPPPGTAVTCAVSGGADSSALLVLARLAGCEVTAVHVDHGLRSGSGAEADVVAQLAERVGATFRAETVVVAPGPNLEARARSARRAVLPSDVLTGHTADDRAETVLINLLRGSGVDGLAGIRPGPKVPLLGLRRDDTVALCAAWGVDPVIDPSNRDRRFVRNRVRHELLPLLDAIAGRDVVPLLCRLADHARDTSVLLADLASGLDPADVGQLRAQPRLVAQVALREWLRAGNDDGHPPDAATIRRVLEVVSGQAKATDVGQGRTVRRSRGRLQLGCCTQGGGTEG